MMFLIDMGFAIAQFALGVLLMHRAIPTVLRDGRWKAFKIWFLASALLLFSSFHFVAAIYGGSNHWINLLAQGLIVAYALQRYRSIVVKGAAVHWTEVF